MVKTINYKRPDGQSVVGYLAEPAKGTAAPGMVVIQEWWGPTIRLGVADSWRRPLRALVDLTEGRSRQPTLSI